MLLKFGGSVDILTATDHARPDPRLFLDYHLKPGLFVPNGCMATGGSALNWFARQFAGGEKQAADAAGLSIHQWLDRLAEARPAGSDGLVVTPYFLGEKTPIHDANARATFDGLTLSHDIGHLWRALLEAYAYAIAHHVEVMNEIGYKTERFIVSDGGSTSRNMDANRRRRPRAPCSAARRPSRLVRRRRLDGRDRRGFRVRLVGDLRLRAPRRSDRAST